MSKKYRYLPTVGAVIGGVLFPLVIAKSVEAVWEILLWGWAQQMNELGFVAFLGAVFGAILFLIPALVIGRRLSSQSLDVDSELGRSEGIRGWLLIPACWFSLCPALHLFSTIHHIVIVQHYSPKSILAFDVFNSILLFLVGSAVCLFFFKEAKLTPKLASAYFIVGLAYALVRPLLATALNIPEPLPQLVLFFGPRRFVLIVAWLILNAVWFSYFFRSKRMRSVFFR